MSELKIDLSDKRTAFQPGEEVSGTVSWIVDPLPRSMELRLFWFTRGKGTEDAGVVGSLKFDRLLQKETRSFRFQLPPAPYSFSGTLISLLWALELIAYPSKEVVRCEIEMGPGRREIRLESVGATTPARAWLSIKTR